MEPIQYLSTTFELGGVPAEVGVNLTDGGRQWWRWRGMTLEREAWRWERLIWSPRPLLGLREPPPDPEMESRIPVSA